MPAVVSDLLSSNRPIIIFRALDIHLFTPPPQPPLLLTIPPPPPTAPHISRFCSPSGTAQPRNGSSSCLDCAPGKAQWQNGSSRCLDCGINTFAATSRSSRCIACPKGRNATTASVACSSCGAGRFRIEMSPYSYDDFCEDCPSGYAQSKPSEMVCSQCTQGRMQDKPRQASCLPCVPGKHQNNVGATLCKDCRPGSYRDAKSEFDSDDVHLCKSCPS
jgi:hypothetical protein